MKRKTALLLAAFITVSTVSACGGSGSKETTTEVKQAEEEVAVQGEIGESEKSPESEITENKGESLFLKGMELMKDDPREALKLFEEAASEGNSDGKFMAGYFYDYNPYNLEKDYKKAGEYYEDIAEENPYAKICLAYLYEDAQGVDFDEDKAKKLGLEAIASLDESSVQSLPYADISIRLIGETYESELFDRQDYAKAKEWYEKSAELDNTDAMVSIGRLYEEGKGVEQDYKKAKEWYEKSAELDNTDAMVSIGRFYEEGKGVEQDYKKAMEWYEKSAQLGNTYAMYSAGHLYDMQEDNEKAAKWYEKGAQLGYGECMAMLGALYEYGEGVEQDYEKAMEWYKRASQLGSPAAMYCMSGLYLNGLGVERDPIEAKKYMVSAVEQMFIYDLGDSYLFDKLEELYNELASDPSYSECIEGSDAALMSKIAEVYEKGEIVDKDEGKAKRWKEMADKWVEAISERIDEKMKSIEDRANELKSKTKNLFGPS